MYKIKSLNRDSISDDDAPIIRKEAQEENALVKYNKALKLQCANEYEEAEDLLRSLLEDDIPDMESRGGLPKTMSTLKYSCYLNIGTIHSNLGNKQKALDYYSQASEIDKTDVTLWFKIGVLALELDHFKQSAYAFSKGLDCNKRHWPSLDKIIMLLYAMRDTVSCLYYISRALQIDPDYTRGLILRKRIYEKNPGTRDYYQLFNPDHIYDPPLNTEFDEIEGKELENESNEISKRIRVLEIDLEQKPLPVLKLSKPLEEYTWLAVGESISHMHRYIAEEKLSFISRITLSEKLKQKTEESNFQEIAEMTSKEEDIDKTVTQEIKTTIEKPLITDQPIINTETEQKMDIEFPDQESDAPFEFPEISDTDNETEKEEKLVQNDCEIMEIEENLFPSQTSKSDSQDNQQNIRSSLDEDTDKKSENDNNTDSAKETDKNESKNESANKSRTHNRRRRNSLSFLQPWAWHSKRKSNRKMGKNDKDDSIEGALRRIIPNTLLPNGLKSDKYKELNSMQQDDSLNTMDLYKLFIAEREKNYDTLPDIISPSEDKPYFGTQQETEDVQKFWKQNFERCDMIALIENYVINLAKRWDTKFPTKLKQIYMEIYEMYREHFNHPNVFSDQIEFKELKNDTEITLLYGELIFDEVQEKINKGFSVSDIKQLPCNSLSTMEFISTRKSDWGPDYLKINLRLYWLKANIYMAENKNDLAIRSLNAILYFIEKFTNNSEEKYYLFLSNCNYNSVITYQNTIKLLQSLEMLQKLSTVEKLYENKCYKEVIEILKESFNLKNMIRQKTKIDGPIQIVMLLHALWLTNREDCLLWTEICLNESLPMYFKTYAQPDSFEHKRWTLVVVKCMVLMEACVKEESIIVLDALKETQVRLVENLTSIVCHQLNSKSMESNSKIPLESVKPWILLHYILQREEHRIQAKRRNIKHCKTSDDSDDEQIINQSTKSDDSEEDDEQDVPPSIQILFTAHEFLGRRGWCLESGGEILLFLVDVILYRLNAPIFEGIREKIEIHIEQAFFCLYQHPSKKNKVSRHLADHNVDPLSLSWERAQQLYEFYQPKALPEFDSYRYNSISNEMEQLLLRILALVPPDIDPHKILPQVTDFINGQIEVLPTPIEFPHKVSAIYYLLGDYYLKLHEATKGLKYFLLDLCINPTRLDTWADMALAMASQLETKLNHCEPFNGENEFLDKVRSAQICFKQSLDISSGHAMLWIEYGNFVYMAHSFCSRLLKGDTDMLSMEKFEALESQKESMLDKANECFAAASTAWAAEPGEHDERWLHHYMLGKIAEKKKQDPGVYLDHYSQAAKLLYENKATYPIKINYSNPQHLSVEALEIHYRIHASILKYLELHEEKPISKSIGKIFQKYLQEANNGLFSMKPQINKNDNQFLSHENSLKRISTEQIIEQSLIKKRRLSEANILEEVTGVMDDMLTKVENYLKTTEAVVLDSEDETQKIKLQTQEIKYPKIKIKNAQEIMDDMMKVAMANQPEYKSETETDAETDPEKPNEMHKHIPKSVEAVSSPSRRGSTTSTAATTTTTTTSDSSDASSSDDSSSSSSDSESSETESNSDKKSENAFISSEDLKKIIDQCLLSLEQCIIRFTQNYKALYRLTHFYLNSKKYKNLNKCRQLMLTEYHCTDATVVTGLFSDKKNNNFFNGVWRIPTSEIDRPGSFASHMSRCVQILMQVLRDSDDHKTLLDLCLILRRTPEPDKIYIRDVDRIQLSEQALSICIQSLRGMVKKITHKKVDETDPQITIQETEATSKLIMELYRAYQKVQKHLPRKESIFSGFLTDAYKHFMQNKLPDGDLLEMTLKFCQTRKISSRMIVTPIQSATIANMKQQQHQQQQQQQALQSSVNLIQAPIAQSTPVQPLKRPSKSISGRPRGRPPNINKHLTGLKQKSRDTNFFTPTNPYAWPNLLYPSTMGTNYDPKFALNYMMSKYQEELIRQYSNLGSRNSILSNPFAVNSMMSSMSSGLTGHTISAPVGSLISDLKLGESSKIKTTTPISSTILSSTSTEKKDTLKSDPTTRLSKYNYPETSKESTRDISIFKDRPGISITPIQQTSNPIKNLPPPSVPLPSSPKTLQQKLAERQKQQQKNSTSTTPNIIPSTKSSSKHESAALDLFNQYQNFSQPQKNISFAKPNIPLPPVPHGSKLNITSNNLPPKQSTSHMKNLQKSIPSSLTITKAHQNLLTPIDTRDAGISISQIPLPQTALYNKPDVNLMNFRKPSAPKFKTNTNRKLSEFTVTPNYKISEQKKDNIQNIPMGLSITKKDDKKEPNKGNDNIEIITIE